MRSQQILYRINQHFIYLFIYFGVLGVQWTWTESIESSIAQPLPHQHPFPPLVCFSRQTCTDTSLAPTAYNSYWYSLPVTHLVGLDECIVSHSQHSNTTLLMPRNVRRSLDNILLPPPSCSAALILQSAPLPLSFLIHQIQHLPASLLPSTSRQKCPEYTLPLSHLLTWS